MLWQNSKKSYYEEQMIKRKKDYINIGGDPIFFGNYICSICFNGIPKSGHRYSTKGNPIFIKLFATDRPKR